MSRHANTLEKQALDTGALDVLASQEGDSEITEDTYSETNTEQHQAESSIRPFASNEDYLSWELARLDIVLREYTEYFRKEIHVPEKPLAATPNYITHEEVDHLLNQNSSHFLPSSEKENEWIETLEYYETIHEQRVALSFELGVELPLVKLGHIFSLSEIDLQLMIIALAPELEQKYEKIFAYLQDDIACKMPSIDLVLNLLRFQGHNKWQLRSQLNDAHPLFRSNIVRTIDDPFGLSSTPRLGHMLSLNERIVRYILNNHDISEDIESVMTVQSPRYQWDTPFFDRELVSELKDVLETHMHRSQHMRRNLLFDISGANDDYLLAISHAICAHVHAAYLELNVSALSRDTEERKTQIKMCLREALLQQLPVVVRGVNHSIYNDDPFFMEYLLDMIEEYGWLTVLLTGHAPLGKAAVLHRQLHYHAASIPMADMHHQRFAWQYYSDTFGLNLSEQLIREVTNGFNLSVEAIHSLLKTLAGKQDVYGEKVVNFTTLEALCKQESDHSLETLSVKLSSHYSWDDIVIPDAIKESLSSLCNHVKYRNKVFDEWGFDQKIAYGKGLSALFSGPPGTGKTMAAQVIANALGLTLYKIDLSCVVSKYIGETEKNLQKIFTSAEQSNAILMFDECDAIFGKRTDVSDSHDRYANIEVSFLLQKMEEYEGIVLLTTNLKKNMDDAFVRRIRFIVEFPFPDKTHREQIWRSHFPPEAPVADGLDYSDLAEKFNVSGGSIKNIVMNAAFIAAHEDKPIAMTHIVKSTQKEFEKLGKLTHTFT